MASYLIDTLCIQLKWRYNTVKKKFCTKTESINLKISLPFVKLDMADSRLVLNSFIFSGDTSVYI